MNRRRGRRLSTATASAAIVEKESRRMRPMEHSDEWRASRRRKSQSTCMADASWAFRRRLLIDGILRASQGLPLIITNLTQ
ncbi:hypothetical protein VTI28DRAFT_2037 [Corynascus sepedonium]